MIPQSAEPRTPRPWPADRRRRARILAVDDVPANLDLIRATLEPFGHAVVCAGSVRDALALLSRQRFDLVVCDLHMPEAGGHSLLAAMRADPALLAPPFVCITSSFLGDQDRRRMLAGGAAHVILRPIEPRRLLAEIEACLPPARG